MIKYIATQATRIIAKNTQSYLLYTPITSFCSIGKQKKDSQIKSASQHMKIHASTKLSQVNTSNLPSKMKEGSPSESISNLGKRIELQIFSTQHEPSFIRQYVQSSIPARTVKDFNYHMTNGGQQYEEFPLIKLLSIALRKIEEDNIQVASWKKLQSFIKKRLHRCTIQQNMKLLYIMLKAFPKYRFDYDFIMSICFALKKQLHLMNSQQLKSLFYVLYTNRNEEIRYNNQILANLQSLILIKVLEKCEKKLQTQQKVKGTHLPVQYLYSWIIFGLTLSVRNDHFRQIYEERVLQLIKHFNQRWQAVVLKEQPNKISNQEQVANIIYFACIYDKLVRFRINEAKIHPRGDRSNKNVINFKEQFQKFKHNIMAHTSKKISKLIAIDPPLQRIRVFRSLIELYSFEIVENLLPTSVQNEEQSSIKYPNIINTLSVMMKDNENSKQIIAQKLKILYNLYNNGVIQFEIFRSYYESLLINIKNVDSSLDLVNDLIRIELAIFEKLEQFKPQSNVIQLVLQFLDSNTATYRDFDWYSFHFVTQLLQKQGNEQLSLSSNLPMQLLNETLDIKQVRLLKILQKISEQVKFYDTSKLVNQQIQLLQKKASLKAIQKFFIEIRVNQMQKLKPILAPFNRVPHFSNEKQKLAINSLTQQELTLIQYRLEKKLLNLSGWRVLNLNNSQFAQLSLNERLKFIADNMHKQSKLVEKYAKVHTPLLQSN